MSNLLKKAQDKIRPSWRQLLEQEFEKQYFADLTHALSDRYLSNRQIYPPLDQIFASLSFVEFKETKIIIIGQDPYHSENKANGLAFSVNKGQRIPPSLTNIFKELSSDMQIEIPKTGCLSGWCKQGVLLLNTVLTVEKGLPNSHKNIGWETFTSFIVKIINDQLTSCVFMLWGMNANKFNNLLDKSKHLVMSAPHPSPFSARTGFFGCKHFSKANKFLQEQNRDIVDWSILDLTDVQYELKV